MRNVLLLACLAAGMAAAQTPPDTIEGYWQDIERRILYSPDAPASYVFGRWTPLDQDGRDDQLRHTHRSPAAQDVNDVPQQVSTMS